MHRYLFKKDPCVVLYLISAPLSALSSIAVAGAMAAAVDYASAGTLSELWTYLIFFAAYIALDFLIDTAARLSRVRLVERIMTDLLAGVYGKLTRMSCNRFFQHSPADYIANLTADADVLRDNYFEVLLRLYMTGLRFCGAVVILCWISPLLGGFILVTSLLQTAVPLLSARRLEEAGERYSDAQEGHMRTMKEHLSAFLTIKTFHLESPLEHRYCAAMECAEASRRGRDGLKEVTGNISFIFSSVAHLGVFLMGAALTIAGAVSTAQVVAASQLIVYISSPIYNLNLDLADLRTARVSARKLQALLDEPEDLGGTETLPRPSGHLTVKNLRFAYGGKEVLSGVTYDFQPGKKYLITGPSGSGKSTLLHLAAGLQGDYGGEITLGGVELRRLRRESVTDSMCLIHQEPFLFDDTLYQNVSLYSSADESAVTNALCRAELGPFLDALPKGIHTSTGENAMSGGEKQRTVIARALVRGAPLLLLDESTSHLDPSTAAGIERLVLGLEGVTVLLVSHNATDTARRLVDEVLEMKDGTLQKIS